MFDDILVILIFICVCVCVDILDSMQPGLYSSVSKDSILYLYVSKCVPFIQPLVAQINITDSNVKTNCLFDATSLKS